MGRAGFVCLNKNKHPFMFSFISFIGFVLLLSLAAGYFLRNRFQLSIMQIFHNKRRMIYLAVLGLFLALSNQLFFYSRFGHQYYLVYPTGGWSTVFSSGFKFRWFATIQEWQKEIDIKVVAEDASTEGIEGIILDQVTFITSSGQKE